MPGQYARVFESYSHRVSGFTGAAAAGARAFVLREVDSRRRRCAMPRWLQMRFTPSAPIAQLGAWLVARISAGRQYFQQATLLFTLTSRCVIRCRHLTDVRRM